MTTEEEKDLEKDLEKELDKYMEKSGDKFTKRQKNIIIQGAKSDAIKFREQSWWYRNDNIVKMFFQFAVFWIILFFSETARDSFSIVINSFLGLFR